MRNAATYHVEILAEDSANRSYYRGELNGRPTGLVEDIQHAFIFSRAGAVHECELLRAQGAPAFAVMLNTAGTVRRINGGK